MKQIVFAVALITLIGLIAACPSPPPSPKNTAEPQPDLTEIKSAAPDYQWVQLGEGDAVIARAIFKKSGNKCPNIETIAKDGKNDSVAMQSRKTQEMPPDFDVTVCEASIADSGNLVSATLAGKNLTIPTKSPKRVVVIGNTGCRVTAKTQQNCNDVPGIEGVDEWLFTKTVSSAVNLKPDLVIHVGDYVYREAPCTDAKLCGDINNPQEKIYGQNWATWKTDFFDPAKPLLESVPWVFARGNHEDCSREFRGWYLFLDPRSLTDTSFTQCNTHSDPYRVSLDGLDLLVLDSADELGLNQNDVNQINAATKPLWLITHVPFLAVGCCDRSGSLWTAKPKGDGVSDTEVINAVNSKASFLVSGHLHLFEMIIFDNQPSQMIAGGGATELDEKVDPAAFADRIKKADFNANADSEVLNKFTFSYIDFSSDNWKVTVMGQDGVTEQKTYTIVKK